jgi:hypothetical protein
MVMSRLQKETFSLSMHRIASGFKAANQSHHFAVQVQPRRHCFAYFSLVADNRRNFYQNITVPILGRL